MGDNDTLTLEYQKNTVIDDISNGLVFTISIMAMFLNISTIMALSHLPWSSRSNIRLVSSLCMANLVFSFNYFIYMIAYYSNPNESGNAISCLLFEVLSCLIYLYIYFNITFIVFDLYLAVTYPLGYASIATIGRTNKLLIMNIIICVLIAGMAIIFNYITLKDETALELTQETSCAVYPNFLYIRSIHWIFKASVFICIPVFIVLLIIILLAVKATESAANRASDNQASNIRGVINVYFVVTAFLFCFGPYQFLSFYIQYSPDMYPHYKTLAQIFERMFYLNAFLTPLIYSLRMTNVKKGYTLMFKKCISVATDYQSVLYGEKSMSGNECFS